MENDYLYHTYYLRQFFCGKGNNYFWKQQTYQGFFLRKNSLPIWRKENPPAVCRDKSEILQGVYII